MKITVEVLEHISYSTQEIEGYECCLMWDSNKEYIYLYSYRDSYVLKYLEQKGITTDDVVIEYVSRGFEYVA